MLAKEKSDFPHSIFIQKEWLTSKHNDHHFKMDIHHTYSGLVVISSQYPFQLCKPVCQLTACLVTLTMEVGPCQKDKSPVTSTQSLANA